MRHNIKDLQANESVQEVYLLAAASLQQSRNGPYWRMDLRDATGNIEAKIWSPLSAAFSCLEPGQFVRINAKSGLFREQIQLTIDELEILSAAEQAGLKMEDFLPASERPAEDMLADLLDLCQTELSYGPWRRLVESVFKNENIRSRFMTCPGAKVIHHAYCGGLLEHSLSVARLCRQIAGHYPAVLDRQLLISAAILHDLGKIEEMSGGLVNDYTSSGKLTGHIVLGLFALEPYLAKAGLEPDLILHFRHLILSHHGQLEYGSPVLPATAEAFVLHHADNIDAKVAQLRGLFAGAAADLSAEDHGMVWSPWNNLLGRRLALAPRTPADADKGKGQVKDKPAKDARQCSLL